MDGVKRKLKIVLASSHGGHLTEILALKDVFHGHDCFYITYKGKTTGELEPAYRFGLYFKNPVLFFTIWFSLIRIFLKERPDVIFSTGAELAIPVFYVAKILFGCRLIYLECSAQVEAPSLTGRIVYPITDLFLVQWEPLLKRYGKKARWRGGLI
ncbi:MAG: capsular polysaccharide biosynthesis protein [bacterium]|nr:MAG: capsular polysaccharide biosynthesis protein [bacterium]